MALKLRNASQKLFNPVLNLIRHRSRSSSLPSLFWEDPFARNRRLMNDFWNSDPFDFAIPRIAYRVPYREGEKYLSTPDDGFQVSLNVENFKPEEVTVKVADNNIIIEAKHEERNEDDEGYVSRHFSRRYTLPENCSIKDIVSTLSSDGILTVRAPPKEVDTKNARKIHIQHTGTTHIGEPEKPKQTEETKETKSSDSETNKN